MEVVASVSYVERALWVSSLMETVVVETVCAAAKSLACLIFVTGSLLDDVDALPKLTAMDERFPFEELYKKMHPGAENKDASDTEDDGEDDNDDNAEDQDDDDAGDEDFSDDEGEDADPEDDPEVNGEGGSDDDEDDEDDDDDDGGDEDDDDGEDEEEEEEEEEDIPQPPSKKRK